MPSAAALIDLVVHEMRTPITVATGSLRQVGPLSDAGQQAAIDRALRSCARLDQLATQLRDWVRTTEAPPLLEPHALPGLVRAAAAQASATRASFPAVQIDEGPAFAAGGSPALIEALAALIEAVARASEPGEAVRISWTAGDTTARVAIRRGDRPDADPAAGFDAELMGGLGFALPLARAVVESSGGRLASRRDGQGRLDAVTVQLAAAALPR
jgi:signal transduction histidine kinase